MLRKLMEIVVFCFVLLQIVALASYIKKDKAPEAAQRQAAAASIYTPPSYQPPAHTAVQGIASAHQGAMQDMAQKEAERIVQTGDTATLQKQIHRNKGLLKVMGYNF